MKFTKLKTISLKSAPQLNEKWIQEVIAADPTILGLGELRLIQKEKIQPTGGVWTCCDKKIKRAGLGTKLSYSLAQPMKPTLFLKKHASLLTSLLKTAYEKRK